MNLAQVKASNIVLGNWYVLGKNERPFIIKDFMYDMDAYIVEYYFTKSKHYYSVNYLADMIESNHLYLIEDIESYTKYIEARDILEKIE